MFTGLTRWFLVLVIPGMFASACAPAAQPEQAQPTSADKSAQQPQYGGVLLKWLGGDPPTFDSHQSNTYQTAEPFHPSYNTIIRYDPLDATMGKIIPDLAHKWELSADGLTYTFHLVPNATFHDATKLTAEDVLFSMERIKEPPKGVISPRRGQFTNVKEFQAPDASTFKIVLTKPTPSLIPNLAQGWNVVYSKKWLEAGHDPAKEVNGSGPFQFKEYIRGTSLESVKWDGYWKKDPNGNPLPYLDGVKHFIITDAGTSFAALRTGQLHMYGGRAEDALVIERDHADKIAVQRYGGLGKTFLNLNTKRKPWDDVRVRRAANLAIDKEQAIKVVGQGEGYVGGVMPPWGSWALPPEELAKIPGYGKDTEARRAEAKKLLGEAGYPNGFDAKMGIRKVAGAEDAGIYAKDQLAKVGVNIVLDIQETATAYTNMERGDYDTFMWGTGYALDDPDAIFGEHFLCGVTRNYQQLCMSELDALFEKQSQTIDPKERLRLVNELERMTLNAHGKITVLSSAGRLMIWKNVKQFVSQPNTFSNRRMEEAWLAK